MRSPGTSPVMLQCTSGSTDGQTKGLIMTVYSVEWISPRPVQTSRPTRKQTKHWLHNVLHAVPMDMSVWPMENMGSISL